MLTAKYLAVLDKIAGFAFGLGLALQIVHNPQIHEWLVPYTGLKLLMFSIPYLFLRSFKSKIQFEPLIHIPFAIILIFTAIGMGVNQNFHFLNSNELTYGAKTLFSPIIYTLFAICVYVIVKANPKTLQVPFALTLIIVTASIVWTAFTTGLKSGGIVSIANYDVVVPLLLVGCLVSPPAWRYWLSGVSVVGLFFCGAEIGLVASFLAILVIIIKRNFTRKLLIPAGALLICLLIATPFGVTQKIWVHNGVQGTLGDRAQAAMWVFKGEGNIDKLDYLVTGNRINGNWHIRPVTLTGYGLEINRLTEETPHNQFLIMTDQIGILAALAWLVATFSWAWKTRNWYLLAVIIGIGALDHFFWTAGILWWWMLLALPGQDVGTHGRQKSRSKNTSPTVEVLVR